MFSRPFTSCERGIQRFETAKIVSITGIGPGPADIRPDSLIFPHQIYVPGKELVGKFDINQPAMGERPQIFEGKHNVSIEFKDAKPRVICSHKIWIIYSLNEF